MREGLTLQVRTQTYRDTRKIDPRLVDTGERRGVVALAFGE